MLLVDLNILVKFVHKSSSGRSCLPFFFVTHLNIKYRSETFAFQVIDSQ